MNKVISQREAIKSYLREHGATEKSKLIREAMKTGITKKQAEQGYRNTGRGFDGALHFSVFVGGGDKRRKEYARLVGQPLPPNHQDFGYDEPILNLTTKQYHEYLRKKQARPIEAVPWAQETKPQEAQPGDLFTAQEEPVKPELTNVVPVPKNKGVMLPVEGGTLLISMKEAKVMWEALKELFHD